MSLAQTAAIQIDQSKSNKKFLLPLILVTSLFFLWGMAYGLLDVLNKHFQETLVITKTRSALLQAAYFGAYFLMALPAGLFMNKYGYKKGIILGLLLYAAGAFLFYPAAMQLSFNFFLIALFILACGLTCLETAANPYVTVLGDPKTSAFRLNLSQCFNGVGSFIGPIIAANLFFSNDNASKDLSSVRLVYVIIGIVVLFVGGVFVRTPLPEINESRDAAVEPDSKISLWKFPNFRGAVIAQFFYVAAQVGVAAFFINYCSESTGKITNADASYLLFISLLLFTIGRFAGTALLKTIRVNILLGVYSIINIALCTVVILLKGLMPVYALMAIFFFESIMFPSIFALGIKGVGAKTKKASSFIIMSIVGGALVPLIMGIIADKNSTAIAYIVPLFCFIVVAWYGFSGYRVKHNRNINA